MKRKISGFSILYFGLSLVCFSQVDTSFVYDTSTPFGGLDIRIAKSPTDYYYLQEDKTFSFRESAPGVKTDTYFDMTSWDSSPFRQGNLREQTGTGDNFVMNYRFLVPDNYNPSYAAGYPLIIVLHGLGERGNCEEDICYHADLSYDPVVNNPPAPTNGDNQLLNNDHNLLHGGKEHLAAVKMAAGKLPNDETLPEKAFPGFILFPQDLNGWNQVSVQDAIRMLRLMIKKYNIDENRVYIEGISNGGHGMYEALKRAPWLFAAAIGMSPIDDGFVNIQGMAPAIAHIPLWIFQGGFDQTPYPSKTRRYVQQFRAAGADVRLTLYPELGHGTWNTAFKEPDFFTWMLGKNKTDIHSFEKSKVICSEEGTKLEVGPGFKAYQWQFNGTTIAGADSSVYFAKAPGSYKVRFARVENPTEGQWTGWSDAIALAVEPPPQANIHQIGTVLLRDLNDNKNAVLEASEDHAHYYWYKNGHLVDTPSNEDDTLKTVIIDPSFGKGAYTLAVADFGCKSDPSAAKNIIFGNAAPITIASPSEFDGISLSPSENSLVWKDNSADEGGFEIWRKRKISNAQFSPWEMATITGPNVVMYTDTALIPQSEYFYKIRAVSSTARSEYVPAPENDALAVQTAVDNELPTAPAALKAQVKGVQSFLLSWKPSNDNTRIRQYYIYLNDDSVVTPTPDTSFMLTNVPLNKNYEIAVRGVDLSGNPSTPSNIVKVTTYFSGLYYEHSTGTWTDLDSIDWTLAEFTGTVRTFTLAPKTQDDYFNFRFDGFLYIENGGNYEFRTSSDDGSRLKLNNQLVVDNDGMHALRTVASARVNLSTGAQRITAEFFDYTESDSLLVEYKGADTGEQWAVIPRDALKSDESVMALGPDNGPEDSFIVSVYPNPATQDNIHVQVETLAREPVLVRLIDPIGKNLFEGAFDADEISHGISISTPGAVQTGLYVIAVDQGKTRVRKKLIIKR